MNFLSTRILKKKVSKKLLSSTPVLKIDNNNNQDHVTLKTGVMLEIQP